MTVKGGARAAAFATSAFLTLGAPSAGAHPEFSALGTNRYVTAAVLDGRVDVTDVLLEGLLPAGDDRRRFDADGDGSISPAELAAARERLRAEGPAVTVTVDDGVLSATLEVSVELGDEPGASAAPLVIERRQSFDGALPPGTHRLRFVVTREPPRLLETELGVVLGPGVALREGPARVSLRGSRASALEVRAATFVIERTPPQVTPRRGPPLLFGFVALAIFVVTLAGAAFRRRARRSAR
ncbi:MAG: hypothetical protein JWM82_4159 [Myxococcales bacterium]|nr:hypothetical protein [Myxococcales bacterium]